jgi:hypothetical protein
MPNTKRDNIIYTRITKDEREMLDRLSEKMVRARSDVIRFLIRKEYDLRRVEQTAQAEQSK